MDKVTYYNKEDSSAKNITQLPQDSRTTAYTGTQAFRKPDISQVSPNARNKNVLNLQHSVQMTYKS